VVRTRRLAPDRPAQKPPAEAGVHCEPGSPVTTACHRDGRENLWCRARRRHTRRTMAHRRPPNSDPPIRLSEENQSSRRDIPDGFDSDEGARPRFARLSPSTVADRAPAASREAFSDRTSGPASHDPAASPRTDSWEATSVRHGREAQPDTGATSEPAMDHIV
jgi:hypothetical protein